jgi:hypothetical protein
VQHKCIEDERPRNDQNVEEIQEKVENGKVEFLMEKKEQVVETTCGSHEKTSKDNLKKSGEVAR